MIGALPALLAFYMQFKVEESPAWLASHKAGKALEAAGGRRDSKTKGLLAYLPSFLFLVVLMFLFTSFSHGSQDLYPTFLEKDRGLATGSVGIVVVIANLGALFGGICCGAASERFGRKRTIIVAALLAVPMVPLWAWSHSIVLLAAGGFLLQFMIQGAWGVIPAHLNELSPGPVRAIFPGLAYQLGNLLSSRNGVFQAAFALRYSGGLLGMALSGTVVVVALAVAAFTALGSEAKGGDMSMPSSNSGNHQSPSVGNLTYES
jgi:SHS family lactate transporter-like MFS transporter